MRLRYSNVVLVVWLYVQVWLQRTTYKRSRVRRVCSFSMRADVKFAGGYSWTTICLLYNAMVTYGFTIFRIATRFWSDDHVVSRETKSSTVLESSTANLLSIATSKIRTLPELRGSADVRFDTPDVYLPDLPPLLTDRELPQIEQVASIKTDVIDSIQRSLAATPRLLEVDTLFHVHQTSRRDESLVCGGWIVSSTAVAFCLLLCASTTVRK
jgi:hypothetical protein